MLTHMSTPASMGHYKGQQERTPKSPPPPYDSYISISSCSLPSIALFQEKSCNQKVCSNSLIFSMVSWHC